MRLDINSLIRIGVRNYTLQLGLKIIIIVKINTYRYATNFDENTSCRGKIMVENPYGVTMLNK